MLGSTKKKKIFILQGNPVQGGMCDILCRAYADGATKAGHEVRMKEISDMGFDPILHDGYNKIQELEPDLIKLQENIKWCDHFVLYYPMWWSAMPAVLKGMFDRMWLPGFAFHFKKNGMGWTPLLKGKTGRVIITMDSWPMISRFFFGDTTNEIDQAILEFSGIKPTRVQKIGPVKTMSDKTKKYWKGKMENWGARAF